MILFTDNDGNIIKFNFDNIPINELELLYEPYWTFTLHPAAYGTVLRNINEQANYTYSYDIIQKEMTDRYKFLPWQISCKKMCNKNKVVIIIPDIDDNIERIESDMKKYGYWLAIKKEYNIDEYKTYMYCYFEPLYPDSMLNKIKEYGGTLIHVTPMYNFQFIFNNKALIPKESVRLVKYPPRLFFIMSDCSLKLRKSLMKLLNDDNQRKTNKFLELYIDVDLLQDNIEFYGDPNYELGVFTYDTIPFNSIIKINEVNIYNNEEPKLIWPVNTVNEDNIVYNLMKNIPYNTYSYKKLNRLNEQYDMQYKKQIKELLNINN